MSKVSLFAFGSTGDVYPFLALGKGLVGAGHEVTLVAPSVFQRRIEGVGCAFRSFGPPVDDAFVRDLAGRAIAIKDPIAQLDLLFEEGVCRGAEEVWRTSCDVVSASDVVVTYVTGAPALAAAELLKKPLVTGVHHDGLVPSAHHGFPGVPGLGRLLNPLAWRLGSWLVSRSLDRWFNVYRTLGGLPPAYGFMWGRVFGGDAVLVGSSPAACGGRRPDWPANVHLTGNWFLDEPSAEPPPELVRFLDAGAPPVLISFGSAVLADPVGFTRAAVEAAKVSGARVVLQEGWSRLGHGVDLPPEVFNVGFVPHDWLVPRCSAVVHLGGHGPTNAAWRAGVPSVALPQGAFDQPFWAARLARLGTGVSYPFARVTGKKLGALIRDAQAPAVRERCQALAARMREEDGVGQAVKRLEEIVAARR